MSFNEQAYLAANPDVAAAVARGEMTASQHFQNYGQQEGRQFFDEQAYLGANPDVAAAVAGGGTTAAQHFLNYGQHEGRSSFDDSYARQMQAHIDSGNPQLVPAAWRDISADRQQEILANGGIDAHVAAFNPRTMQWDYVRRDELPTQASHMSDWGLSGGKYMQLADGRQVNAYDVLGGKGFDRNQGYVDSPGGSLGFNYVNAPNGHYWYTPNSATLYDGTPDGWMYDGFARSHVEGGGFVPGQVGAPAGAGATVTSPNGATKNVGGGQQNYQLNQAHSQLSREEATDLVGQWYQKYLGRDASSGYEGFDYWVQQAQQYGGGPESLRGHFLEAANREREERGLEPIGNLSREEAANLVRQWYQQYLGRDADSGYEGFDYWVQQAMQYGGGPESLRGHFLEAANREREEQGLAPINIDGAGGGAGGGAGDPGGFPGLLAGTLQIPRVPDRQFRGDANRFERQIDPNYAMHHPEAVDRLLRQHQYEDWRQRYAPVEDELIDKVTRGTEFEADHAGHMFLQTYAPHGDMPVQSWGERVRDDGGTTTNTGGVLGATDSSEGMMSLYGSGGHTALGRNLARQGASISHDMADAAGRQRGLDAARGFAGVQNNARRHAEDRNIAALGGMMSIGKDIAGGAVGGMSSAASRSEAERRARLEAARAQKMARRNSRNQMLGAAISIGASATGI